jgi:hypothetical protein
MKRKFRNVLLGSIVALVSALVLFSLVGLPHARAQTQAPSVPGTTVYLPLIMGGGSGQSSKSYVIIGWNDLGMHCYDRDYSTLTVLPPYNNLFSQVIKRGDPPQLVSSGVNVSYSFPDNTYSAGKTNFWDYAPKIFGATLSLNVGLSGKGLAGSMDATGNHFVAEGVPVTEFSDSAPTTPDYFQLARMIVKDLSGKTLAQSDVVAPVSSEMRCDVCHKSPSPTNFRLNILQKHDNEEGTHLASQANSGNPVLCSSCHADPALGMVGKSGLPSLSAAMHGKHAEETNNCYACHPGPNTQCLRDVMSTQFGMTCTDCHQGGMQALANENRTPWVDEPRCANCHDTQHAENPGKLFKQSTGHGGLYCEACHNSTHAILTSREAKDNLQSIALQGFAGTISKCTVCHLTTPTSGGPHK